MCSAAWWRCIGRSPEVPAPLVLDAWAAQTCPVKTWYAHSPGVAAPEPRPDESLRESFAGGQSLVDEVLDSIVRQVRGQVIDLRPLTDRPVEEQLAACRAALASGPLLIIGGLLPGPPNGHRSGRPHLLVRGTDTGDTRPGFHPVQIKRRRLTEPRIGDRSPIRVSSLAHPSPDAARALAERTLKPPRDRDGYLLQLAHYWRLLQSTGYAAAEPPLAGVIGTDDYLFDPAGEPAPGIGWIPLDVPLVRTFSRSSDTGWRLRTALERYDHEFDFRLKVAETARAGGPQLVQPIRNRECQSCAWWQRCEPVLGADDISVRIDKTPLDVREIGVLRGLGIRTVTELAETELAELKPRYLPEVRHREGAEKRIENAHRRARLMLAGVELERVTTGPIDVPAAEIEVDLDLETSADDRIYLWGFWVHDRRPGAETSEPRFVEFSAWSDLDAEGEQALAVRALGWLRELAGSAEVRVYHYSPFEVHHVQRLAAAAPDHPVLGWALDHTAEWCDLFTVVRDHYFGTRGLGLKVVATLGAGFRWRDEEPGGLASQAWFAEACHGPTPEARAAARQRVLDYNEDDVRATWRLRHWLRAQP
ncbi:nuclease [Enemella evansiae]|nr:nuclease [Enemella evansiae]